MKKIISLLLSFALILTFLSVIASCKHKEATPHEYTSEEREAMRNPSFSSSPFFAVKEGEKPLADSKMKSVISSLPADRYETYPNLHNVPLTATLYKDGKEIPVDLKDKRLIRLMNFYNNSIYYNQYAYTQGLLTIDYIEKACSEPFRLELTFDTTDRGTQNSYDTNIQAYDTFIITNKNFTLLAHDLPGYEGKEDRYPFKAVGHNPLFKDYSWLDLFGF